MDRRGLDDDIAAANLAQAQCYDRLRLHRVDLSMDALESMVQGVDTVFHLAGRPGVRESWGAGFVGYVSSNVVATNRLIDLAERAGARRLVFASSSSVYGSAAGPASRTARRVRCRPTGSPNLPPSTFVWRTLDGRTPRWV